MHVDGGLQRQQWVAWERRRVPCTRRRYVAYRALASPTVESRLKQRSNAMADWR